MIAAGPPKIIAPEKKTNSFSVADTRLNTLLCRYVVGWLLFGKVSIKHYAILSDRVAENSTRLRHNFSQRYMSKCVPVSATLLSD